MRVLVVTNMWPAPGRPQFGVFVQRQVDELRRVGVDVDVVFIDGQTSRLNYVKGFRDFKQALRNGPHDLVHAHYVFSGVIARSDLHHPILLTHHGIEAFTSWQKPLCWAVSRVVDAVTVVSPDIAAELGLRNAVVLPNGIDLEVFKPIPQDEARKALALPPSEEIVLYVGEARPEKRLDLIHVAVELLRSERPNSRFVHLTGKTQDEVALYMNAADVLVLASDFEGDPMVIKEAMATNLPIVTTPVGALRRVVEATEGCFVCTQSPEDLAAKLHQALVFGSRTNGREAVIEFAWPEIVARLVAVYETVVKSKRKGRAGRSASAVE